MLQFNTKTWLVHVYFLNIQFSQLTLLHLHLCIVVQSVLFGNKCVFSAVWKTFKVAGISAVNFKKFQVCRYCLSVLRFLFQSAVCLLFASFSKFSLLLACFLWRSLDQRLKPNLLELSRNSNFSIVKEFPLNFLLSASKLSPLPEF